VQKLLQLINKTLHSTRGGLVRLRSLDARIFVLLGVGALSAAAADHYPAQAAETRMVRVGAAADLKVAFADIVAAFQRQNPDVKVEVTYGSSGNFYSQLSSRAPFDLFLSADVDYPRRLVEQGLAAPNSEFSYAVGGLVLWVRKASPIAVEKLGIEALLDHSVRKIAIANPRHAPYGRAAEAALKKLGVYENVKDKLVYGENIIQTAQFVESGAADIGLISHSLAAAAPLRDEGRTWEVPADSYPSLEQGGVILSWAQDRQTAEALRSFILGDSGKKILHRYGFRSQAE
jgi:molybdate transport system substrate-binding protein